MSESNDNKKIKVGTVLYHRMDRIKLKVTKVDGDLIDVEYCEPLEKPLEYDIQGRYKIPDAINTHLFFNEEDVSESNYEALHSANNSKRHAQRDLTEEEIEAYKRERIARETRENLEREYEIKNRKREGMVELVEKLKPYGFEGLCHYTDIKNLEKIFEEGKVYSRRRAEEKKVLECDAADRSMLQRTDDSIKEYVRMFYFPKTPTIFRMQGVHSREDEDNAHMPVPVLLLFKPNIMGHDDVCFLDGSGAADPKNIIKVKDISFAKSFDWVSIQEREQYEDDIDEFERYYKNRRRNAEFLYPKEISIDYIKRIIFRSEAEMKSAIYLYGENPKFSCEPDKFPACYAYDKKHNYYRNYILDYELSIDRESDEMPVIYLKATFKNSNIELYDCTVYVWHESEIIYNGGRKKKNVYGNISAPETWTYKIQLKKDVEHFELMFCMNDHCVLYYKQ